MKSLEYERTLPSAGLQALFVIGSGVALAWMLVHQPMPLVIAALVGVMLVMFFLQRPDLGLLLTLVIRASSDAFIGRMTTTEASGIAARLLTSPNAGLIVILILGGALYLLTHPSIILGLPGAGSLVFLLLLGTVGMLRAPSIASGLDGWLADWGALMAYALAAAVFWKPQQIQRVIDVLAVAFIGPAALGLYQIASRHGCRVDESALLRVCGTFTHPNPFAFFLVIIFSVFLCQVLVQVRGRRLLALAIVGTSAILLLFTQTRAGWAGALIVLLIVGAVRNRRMLLLTPLLITVVVIAFPFIGHRAADPFNPNTGSFADREAIWRGAYQQWLDFTYNRFSDFATLVNRSGGTGPGSVSTITGASYGGAGVAAHNDYLAILFEYGVLGLTTFIIMFVTLIASAYRTWRQSTNEMMKSVALSFFALALAFPLMHFTDNLHGRTQNQLYFWTLAGLTAAIARMTSRTEQGTVSVPQETRLMRRGSIPSPEARFDPRGPRRSYRGT